MHLTTAGKRQLRRLDRALAAAQGQFVAPLAATDRARLDELLTTLLDYHEQIDAT